MSDDPPRIVTRLELAHFFVGVALFANAFLILPEERLMAATSMLGALAIILVVVRRLSTKLTDAGVSQLTWHGRVYMRWSDIKTITRRSTAITVTGGKGSIVLPIESYYDSGAAVRFVDTRLPMHLRQD
jgi:hypothetical protein